MGRHKAAPIPEVLEAITLSYRRVTTAIKRLGLAISTLLSILGNLIENLRHDVREHHDKDISLKLSNYIEGVCAELSRLGSGA